MRSRHARPAPAATSVSDRSLTCTADLRKATSSMGRRGVGNPPSATRRTTTGALQSRLPGGTAQ